jgi:prevent-host-death family protein
VPSDTNIKGSVAELEIAAAAARIGIPVLKPLSEHGRSDLALELEDRLLRVQCKWGRLGPKKDVVIVKTRTSRLSPRGYIQTTYCESDADLIGVYCGALDRCFLLPISRVAGISQIYLRLSPARNGQQACTTLADDFDFVGAIAQLGERRAGSAKVAGSSPASSTSSPPLPAVGSDPPAAGSYPSPAGSDPPGSYASPVGSNPLTLGSNPFRDRLGYWMDRVAAGEEVVITRRGKPRVRLSPAT